MRPWLLGFVGLVLGLCIAQISSRVSQHEGGSQMPESSSEPGLGAAIQANSTCIPPQNLKVIFVLDPNFHLCWESVTIDDFTRHTLLAWLAELRDSLTITAENPQGEYLKIDHDHTHGDVPESAATFKDLITDSLEGGKTFVMLPSNLITAYQLALVEGDLASESNRGRLQLTAAQIGATTMPNFWSMVRSGASYGKLMIMDHNPALAQPYGPELLSEATEGAVFLLPRIVPHIHNYGAPVYRAAEGRALNAAELTRMVAEFLRVAGANSVPSIGEYGILPDKVKLTQMYTSFYEQDPANRVPPIPTVRVRLPGSDARLLDLCYAKEVQSTEAHKDSVKRQLYEAILDLETQIDSHPQAEELRTVTGSKKGADGVELRKYYIKREFSEGAVELTTFLFPVRLLQADDTTRAIGHLARPAIPGAEDGATEREGVVTTAPYLYEAVDFITKRSCAEGWLLQPEIIDMTDLEYRVYLPGGAQASQEDAIVVYTPSVLEGGGIYMANLTIPPGHFYSDVMISPDEAADKAVIPSLDLAAKISQERRLWKAPALYDAIVAAARCAAKAMASYQEVTLASVSRAFVRVDVVLAASGVDDGSSSTGMMLINEMDWFNSAAHMTHNWKQVAPQPWQGGIPLAMVENGLRDSVGFKIAKPLLELIWERFENLQADRQGSQACVDQA